MSLNIKNLPEVIKQAHASVYNMDVVTSILERVYQQNRAAHDEIKILSQRLKEQLSRNAKMKRAFAESEKERLEQAEQQDSVVNENDGRLLTLHQHMNESMLKLQKQAQVICDERARIEEYKKSREILKEQNKSLEENIINVSKDKQQEEADAQVKLQDIKNELKTAQAEIIRLQLNDKDLKMRVEQAASDKIYYQDLERKLEHAAATNSGIREILKGGVKYNSNIKF